MSKKQKKKRKKPGRLTMLRFRKNDHIHNLYAAVQRYVHANSGSVVVIGGIGVMRDPGDLEHKYSIVVRCLGNRPVMKEKADAK